jgi:hypothetical protein
LIVGYLGEEYWRTGPVKPRDSISEVVDSMLFMVDLLRYSAVWRFLAVCD